jgi:hypothetical protein
VKEIRIEQVRAGGSDSKVAAGKWHWENDKWARRKLFVFHEFRNDTKMHNFAN